MSYIVTIIGTYINSLSFENKDDAILFCINHIINDINSFSGMHIPNSFVDAFNLINAKRFEEAIERYGYIKMYKLEPLSFKTIVIDKINIINKKMVFK